MIKDITVKLDHFPPGTIACQRCRGRGEVLMDVGWMRWYNCGDCGGKGYIPATIKITKKIGDTLRQELEHEFAEIERHTKKERDTARAAFNEKMKQLYKARYEKATLPSAPASPELQESSQFPSD